MEQKKGQVQIVAYAVILIIAVVLLAFFIFNNTVKYTVGSFILGFVAFKIATNKDIQIKKGTRTTLFLLLLGGAMVMFFSSGILQSTLSLSTITTSNGNVYWSWVGTANTVNEGYDFFINSVPSYTDPNTKVVTTPTKSLKLSIFKEKNECSYQATLVTKVERSLLNPLGTTYTYWTLNSPERTALIKVVDGNNQVQIIDGSLVKETTFSSNGGSAVLTTQGILASKRDCPSSENVIVIKDRSNNYVYLDRINFEVQSNKGLLSSLFSSTSKPLATAFISGFTDAPKFDENKVVGGLDFGNVVFTIKADQKYFASTSFTPTVAKPSVGSINVQDINEGQTGSMTVPITNSGSAGNIIVTATSNDVSISPSSQNAIIDKSKTFSFSIKANNNVGSKTMTVKACGVDEFNGNSACSSNSATFSIVSSSQKLSEFCGNNVCDASESATSCPQDCFSQKVPDVNLTCGIGQHAVLKSETVGRGWLGIGGIFGLTKTTTTPDCVTDDIIKWILVAIVIGGLGYYAISQSKPKRRR